MKAEIITTPPPRHGEIAPLTGIRAVAALSVLLFHLSPEIAKAFPGARGAIHLLLSQGYLGVDLFFMLSGFILSYNYWDAFEHLRVSTCFRFLWLRLARIYPVHGLVLLLYLVMRLLGKAPVLLDQLSIHRLVANLFLVQAWSLPMTVSWNGPAWSVSCEWLAYLAFPFIVHRMRSRSNAHHVAILLVSAAVVIAAPSFLHYFGTFSYGPIRICGEFVAGMTIFSIFRKKQGRTWPWALIMPAAILYIFVIGCFWSEKVFALFLAVPAFGFIVLGLAYQRSWLAHLLSTRVLVVGGYLSYSMYMIHELLLSLFRMEVAKGVTPPTAGFLQWAVPMIIILAWALAYLLFRFVEEPARLWMRSVLNYRSSHLST